MEFRCLREYQENVITAESLRTQNIDDHSRYLDSLLDIKSLYSHATMCSVQEFLAILKSKHLDEKAAQAWATIETGLSSFKPARVTISKDIWAQYVIWMLQTREGKIIDSEDMEYGEEQNIGLHNIVS